jgi:hypothetical protein
MTFRLAYQSQSGVGAEVIERNSFCWCSWSGSRCTFSGALKQRPGQRHVGDMDAMCSVLSASLRNGGSQRQEGCSAFVGAPTGDESA